MRGTLACPETAGRKSQKKGKSERLKGEEGYMIEQGLFHGLEGCATGDKWRC